MDILERIVDVIPGAIEPEFLWFGLLGLLLVGFVVLLVATMGGEIGKFNKAVKYVLDNADKGDSEVRAGLEMMPSKARRLLNKALGLDVRPSEIMTKEAVVVNPYMQSMSPRLGAVMMLVTWVSVVLMIVGGWMLPASYPLSTAVLLAAVTILVFGCILSLIAGAIGRKRLGKACDSYDDLIDFLEGESNDSLESIAPQGSVGSSDISNDDNSVGGVGFAGRAVQDEPQNEPQRDFGHDPEPIVYSEPTNAPETSIVEERVEPDTPPPIIVTPAPSFEDRSIELRREQEERRRAEDARRAEAAEKARQKQAEEIAKREELLAKAQAEKAKAQADKAAKEKEIKDKLAAQKAAKEPPKASSPTPGSNAKPEDIVARIDQISKEGAPLATMKEVALLLQQERAKPENKTPEQQRKLNEALAALLKAMSTASKK